MSKRPCTPSTRLCTIALEHTRAWHSTLLPARPPRTTTPCPSKVRSMSAAWNFSQIYKGTHCCRSAADMDGQNVLAEQRPIGQLLQKHVFQPRPKSPALKSTNSKDCQRMTTIVLFVLCHRTSLKKPNRFITQ